MTQYDTLNVTSNSQLNKQISGIKNGTETNFSSNVTGD